MPNKYIQVFDKTKNLHEDYYLAAIIALKSLKKARQKRLEGMGWRQILGVDMTITKQHFDTISQLLLKLEQEPKLPLAQIKTLFNTVSSQLSQGRSKELVDHIIMNLPAEPAPRVRQKRKQKRSADESERIEMNLHKKLLASELDATEIKVTKKRHPLKVKKRESLSKINNETSTSAAKEIVVSNEVALKKVKPDEELNTIEKILKQKNLSTHLFNIKHNINLDASLSEHAAWVHQYIYSIPYPESTEPRSVHGIAHAVRVAIYVPTFANLFSKYGDEAARAITAVDVKLAQIAALFHDAGREDDGKDFWDNDSALMLFYYLYQVLEVPLGKATSLAEAIANKDADQSLDNEQILQIDSRSGNASWITEPKRPKNIYQKIIHDADSLDIIRARDHFDATFLDFYQDIVVKHNNNDALNDMAYLITEARSLIATQGDSINIRYPKIKAFYNQADCYDKTVKDIKQFKILGQLSFGLIPIDLLDTLSLYESITFNAELPLSEENMQAAMMEGKIFARGIGSPSAVVKKPLKSEAKESFAALELRKVNRRAGVATTSTKLDANEKHGNPARSVSMLGYGAGVFSPAGYLIINPDLKCVGKVMLKDSITGVGKKKKALFQSYFESRGETQQKALSVLIDRLKLGGTSRRFPGYNIAANHVEILYDVTMYQGVYFTLDATLFSEELNRIPVLPPHAAFLQAIYLQKQYEIQMGISLPIFEYSSSHHFIRQRELPSENELIAMWTEVCSNYLMKKLDLPLSYAKQKLDIDSLKVFAVYLTSKAFHGECLLSADSNYDQSLQCKINQSVAEVRREIMTNAKTDLATKINSGNEKITCDEFLRFMENDLSIINEINKPIHTHIEAELLDAFANINANRDFGGFTKDFYLYFDGEDLNERYQEGMDNLYEVKEFVLLEICKRLNLSDTVSQLKQSALIRFESDFAAFSFDEGSKTHQNADAIYSLFYFAKAFDIYHQVEAALISLVDKYISSICDPGEESIINRIRKCWFFYPLLHTLPIFKPENKKKLVLFFENIRADISSGLLNAEAVAMYVLSASEFSETIDTLKVILTKYFQARQVKLQSELVAFSALLIIVSKPNYLNYPPLFESILASLPRVANDSKCHIDFRVYTATLRRLIRHCKLSSTQVMALDFRLKHLMGKLVASLDGLLNDEDNELRRYLESKNLIDDVFDVEHYVFTIYIEQSVAIRESGFFHGAIPFELEYGFDRLLLRMSPDKVTDEQLVSLKQFNDSLQSEDRDRFIARCELGREGRLGLGLG